MTPGSAVRYASVARHVTDCATRPGVNRIEEEKLQLTIFVPVLSIGLDKIITFEQKKKNVTIFQNHLCLDQKDLGQS